MSKITNDGLLNPVWQMMLYSCTHGNSIGFKGLIFAFVNVNSGGTLVEIVPAAGLIGSLSVSNHLHVSRPVCTCIAIDAGRHCPSSIRVRACCCYCGWWRCYTGDRANCRWPHLHQSVQFTMLTCAIPVLPVLSSIVFGPVTQRITACALPV